MSFHEYRESLEVSAAGHPFYALIFAAMRQADSANMAKLATAFPVKFDELTRRYDAPGGRLPED